MTHEWRTYRALPLLSFDDCARQGCPAKATRWYRDGKWLMRQTAGSVECGGSDA